uniref:Uncharacterized protein n=1 Tax=Trichogramma kaykai TaxID=54128 RepID=A0ABD2W6N6_9HYME
MTAASSFGPREREKRSSSYSSTVRHFSRVSTLGTKTTSRGKLKKKAGYGASTIVYVHTCSRCYVLLRQFTERSRRRAVTRVRKNFHRDERSSSRGRWLCRANHITYCEISLEFDRSIDVQK